VQEAINNRSPLCIGGTEREIVLLDLRLFAQNGPEAEARFIKSLLASGRLPEELREAVSECAGFLATPQFETDAHRAALTFLPRLLAVADHSLPIILFSTTGRNDILKRLSGYPNLITREFEKPQFFAATSDQVLSETEAKLTRAFERAELLSNGRSQCLTLRVNTSRPESDREPGSVMEVYLDESELQQGAVYCVGGMCLIYPNASEIEGLQDRLQRDGKIWGLADDQVPKRFSPAWHPPPHLSKMPDYTGAETAMAAIRPILGAVRCLAIALIDPKPANNGGCSNVLRPDWVDNRHFAMVEELLSAALFSIRDEYVTEIRVHIATRTPKAPTRVDLEKWNRLFGRRPQNETGLEYYSLSTDTPRFLISQLVVRHGCQLPITWARAVVLNDFDKLEDIARQIDSCDVQIENANLEERKRIESRKKKLQGDIEKRINKHTPRPMQIHYLADWLARSAMWRKIPPTAGGWFANGFVQQRNKPWEQWLEAICHARRSEYVDAVFHAISASRLETNVPKWGFSRWVRPEASDWIQKLDASKFEDLCWRLGPRFQKRQ
jgi:hypothetical protein